MNLLITGAWSDALQHIKEIENMGHSVFFLQYEKDKLPCDYQEVDGVICNGLFLYHRIEEFTNLKYIQLTSAGFDRVPIDYIQKHKIVINNARGYIAFQWLNLHYVVYYSYINILISFIKIK